MRVVSENSEADLARQRAASEVRFTLREMTANLLRVVRGAGRPHEIGLQAQALNDAFARYYEAVGHFPHAYDLTGFLDVDRDREMLLQRSEESRARAYAEERVIRGVLQIVASRLLGQGAKAAGDDEMYAGIWEIESLREKARQTFATASARRAGPRVPQMQLKKPKA